MTDQHSNIKVAMASDFLSSFSKIPRTQQTKVLNFVNKFKSNPTLSGINYEKITGAKDPSIRSVRIDQSYRGIVLKPAKGNVYMLLWVANHEEAYQWARNKVYKIHPETGSIQVIEVEHKEVNPESEKKPDQFADKALFKNLKDRQLLKLGVPEEQLAVVRGIVSEDDLDKMADILPQEAYEGLFFKAAGDSYEDILREREIKEQKTVVDTNDFSTALERLDSKRRFFVVEDDLELQAILQAPLEKWRVFLHPSQRKLVEREWNGPVRVLGGAGTGKTVVAIHRASWLAQNVFTGKNDRILFTTFTRNLAEDIKDNLTKICKTDVMRKIEVVNLDRWVSNFLRKNDYSYTIDYGKLTNELWTKALDMAPSDLDLDESFYREEWDRVIQPQAVISEQEYFKASRTGRGVRLNRKARKEVWSVFEEYRLLLDENSLKERDDALRDARLLLEQKNEVLPYKAIIVDEAQDMGMQAFKLIRQMISGDDRKNDLFIVGDAHQRIYRYKVVLGRCGVNIVGRARKLKINYRTTDENRKWAVDLLKGVKADDLDGGIDDQAGYKSLVHGISPIVKRLDNFQSEIEFISQYLGKLSDQGKTLSETCLVARTNSMLAQYENALKEKGIVTYNIRRKEPEDRSIPGLRMATMHRVKGLEFDRVIIAGVNRGVVPLKYVSDMTNDPTVREESEIHERALLYVSATRAKNEVLVTGFGEMSEFL
jgi:hypothetical protein